MKTQSLKEVFWKETKFYPKGYNCVGWAMLILERAGIKLSTSMQNWLSRTSDETLWSIEQS